MGDFYETLGVSKNADAREIKSAYRKVAMKYHPDKNPGDTVAEEKFKEAAEAYSVLSDNQKRAQYDQFGHAAFNNQGGGGGGFHHMDLNDIFDHFGDIFGSSGFSDFFGGSRRGRRSGPARGSDLKITISLTLEEIFSGVDKTVKIKRFEHCASCDGSGAAAGSQPMVCPACEGAGEVRQVQRSFLGQIVNVQPCHQCHGNGQVISNPCRPCSGKGVEKKTATVALEIPAGVSSGNYMTRPGEGNHSGKGGAPGDLIIYFEEKDHPLFTRDGIDIYLNCWIQYPHAVFGTSIEVPTLAGKVNLKVPAGIRSGQVLRLRGKGMQELNRGRQGDQLVRINIETPQKVSKKAKVLMENLSEELTDKVNFEKFR
ncbi:MAG: molecular chaperone DnaJ [Candidatus Marinimicrobia bacterium]|jgi:molecular chaperone DnaJ|nr:molecular chaperone DnaJ [Candidatus Neomarinimicrobiota bacterium]MDP6853128.1 molecular chaperone DnaJ [Candidatus Neomarinimicrobiota bacterium]MDP6936492.1 molecular chaperone DnaJ [Candidatus Neomarinimicrobiota bacterium]